MLDQFNRQVHYLRLSVTERCQLRCTYCRAGENLCPKKKELPAANLIEIAKACAELGIDRVRLTGGEPLLRRDLLEIVKGIRSIPEISDIALTTNAQTLAEQASELKKAGLNRVNISLDSLDPEKFKTLTGGDLKKVLRGVEAAIENDLQPVKLNAVLVKGVNDSELADFVALTRNLPIDVRFIEYMEIGSSTINPEKRVSSDAILKQFPELKPLAPRYFGQPSTDYQMEGYRGRVGLISPISHQFCADCNRIRVMSDGMLRPCLGRNEEVDLLPAISKGYQALKETIQKAIYFKPRMHEFGKQKLERGMSHIGG
ncbi:MAG: GTP 3',8-cyclase MoaA [Anaerolineaceae bacterium]|nr:GTP 3',8-cyclase MoaA [Anaerolineaceae bacterium]